MFTKNIPVEICSTPIFFEGRHYFIASLIKKSLDYSQSYSTNILKEKGSFNRILKGRKEIENFIQHMKLEIPNIEDYINRTKKDKIRYSNKLAILTVEQLKMLINFYTKADYQRQTIQPLLEHLSNYPAAWKKLTNNESYHELNYMIDYFKKLKANEFPG